MDCALRHELKQILAPAGCLCQALCHSDKDVNMNTIATATLCPPKAIRHEHDYLSHPSFAVSRADAVCVIAID